MPISEKQLQKAVEDVRKKGYLEMKFRFDAEKFLKNPDLTSFSAKCFEEGKSIFITAYKILEAYKKKYGNN